MFRLPYEDHFLHLPVSMIFAFIITCFVAKVATGSFKNVINSNYVFFNACVFIIAEMSYLHYAFPTA